MSVATAPDAASLPRRLAATVYDALLLLALLLIATACFLPFTNGEAVTWQRFPLLTIVHRLVIVALITCFYGVFWTRSGQTLGMASWRLRLERLDGTLPTWRDVFMRIAAGALAWGACGLGWLWALWDRDRRTWQDMLSGTRVVVLPKR